MINKHPLIGDPQLGSMYTMPWPVQWGEEWMQEFGPTDFSALLPDEGPGQ
jgi:hypothetical protein